MSEKIIGVTLGTPLSPSVLKDKMNMTGYASKKYVQEYAQPKGEYLTEVPSDYAKTSDIPTKTSELNNDSGFITGYTETDPTVPSWAKAATKPSYTKSEVGLGNVENVKQYSANNPPPYPVTSVNGKTGKVTLNAESVGARPSTWMPTASDVGALPSSYVPPNQTASQVGADPAGTASAAVSSHNTNEESHNDIRLELKAINERLTAFFDSDDKTLDELSEIVAYITSNKALIDSITTSKVSVEDIINNLGTNVANKPLSAAQGVALKALIDAITIPTKLSQLTNDKGYITGYTETDPTVPAWAKNATKPSYTASEVGALPSNTKIPSKTSDLTNDSGFITDYTETDPTVPSWAKAASKPSYSKSEVGLGNVDNVKQYSASNPPPYPVTSVNGKTGAVTVDVPTVPTKVSAFTNDAGYITGYTETDPTVPSWAKAASKPSYTASEVGAVPTSRTVNGKKLSSNITLAASDVGAVPTSQAITVTGIDADGVSHSWTMYGVAQ